MRLFLPYIERVILNSEAHSVFNTNWSSYYTSDFGTTFLSKSNIQRSRNLRVFDAAEIVESIDSQQSNASALFGLKNPEYTVLSFHKDSQASLKTNRIAPNSNEFVLFIEIQNEQEALVSFKLGKEIARQLDLLSEKNDQKTAAIESKKFNVPINDLRRSLHYKTSEKRVLEFSLSTMGFELKTVSIESFEKMIDEALANVPGVDGVLFDAGFSRGENPNSWAHGDIEKLALEGTYTDTEILQIYYGNWLRDYSSAITGSSIGFDKPDRIALKSLDPNPEAVSEYESRFSINPSQKSWVDIITLFAANDFEYKKHPNNHNINDHLAALSTTYEMPTENIVGVYRPEEHIDNPKGLIDETALSASSLDSPVRYTYSKITTSKSPIEYPTKKLYPGALPASLMITSKMKTYIKNTVTKDTRPSSYRYFGEQMRLAKKKGRNKTGFRHFGAALHVLEDFYAHSNFIEVALIKAGYEKVNPWVDFYMDATTKIPATNIDPCKIPIVTGYFGQLDLIASMGPKIANEFFPTSYQPYKDLKEGDRTLADKLIILMLEDYIGKEKGIDESERFSFMGYDYVKMLATYIAYLLLLDKIRKAKQDLGVVGDSITLLQAQLDDISQTLSFLPNLILRSIIDSLNGIVQSRQAKAGTIGTNPSHTQLAKDHADHHFNPLAGYLAYLVVGRVGELMKKCWNGDKEVTIEYIINLVGDRYFVHPCDVDWIDEHIKDWAAKYPDNVKRGESKTTTHEHGQTQFNKLKNDLDLFFSKYA